MTDTLKNPDSGEYMNKNPDLEFTEVLIKQVGEQVRAQLRAGGYETAWKPDNTPVTEIDINVNRFIIESIHTNYSTDRILGEEASLDGESGFTWVVDPIDGTQSLGIVPTSTICIARTDQDGQPLFSTVYNPQTDELFSAEWGQKSTLNGLELKVSEKTEIKGSYIWLGSRIRDQSLATNGIVYDRLEDQGAKILNTRSLAYGAIMVATGKSDGAYICVTTPFEAASVKLIVEGAGGKVTNLFGGDPGRLDGEIRGLIVSNGRIHDELVAAIQKG